MTVRVLSRFRHLKWGEPTLTRVPGPVDTSAFDSHVQHSAKIKKSTLLSRLAGKDPARFIFLNPKEYRDFEGYFRGSSPAYCA